MPQHRREPDLVEFVAPTVRVLCELADAGQALGAAGLPDAGSIAMDELAAEAVLENDDITEPIHGAHSISGLVAFAATDHLRNYARLFESQPVPVYSHLVLARACLDACSLARWISEPGIGPTRRAQRYLVLRLHNAKQQKRSPLVAPKVKAGSIVEEVRRGVAAAGWPLQANMNNGKSPLIGAEEIPKTKVGIESVLGVMPEEAEQIGLGPVLWWYLSGVMHAASYGLMQAVEPQGRSSPVGPELGAIYTDGRSVILMGWAVAAAYVNMTSSRRQLFGWTSSEWTEAIDAQGANFTRFKALLQPEDTSP